MTGFEDVFKAKMNEEARCPICALVEDREFTVLSHLQYEVTHDRDVRSAIVNEGGFCVYHFRQFRKLANSETNARLLTDLVSEYLRRGERIPIHCRVCIALDAYEQSLCEATAHFLESEAGRSVFDEGAGLCLNHQGNVSSAFGDPTLRRWLNESQNHRMQQDLPALEAMMNHSYFDSTRSQRSAIPRCVERFVGRKALGL